MCTLRKYPLLNIAIVVSIVLCLSCVLTFISFESITAVCSVLFTKRTKGINTIQHQPLKRYVSTKYLITVFERFTCNENHSVVNGKGSKDLRNNLLPTVLVKIFIKAAEANSSTFMLPGIVPPFFVQLYHSYLLVVTHVFCLHAFMMDLKALFDMCRFHK
jgi:hypothetical protein